MVDLFIHGEHKKFYIGTDQFNDIYGCAYRDATGHLITNKIATKEKITLIEI